jgi:hypothetical protein
MLSKKELDRPEDCGFDDIFPPMETDTLLFQKRLANLNE